uniref:Calreticulin n=1 Tax=Anopheles coluzzii TaxID=1518534 RepID=A0A8W7PLK5_ANOCL
MRTLAVLFAAFLAVNAKVYFEEGFKDDSWQKTWVQSEHKGVEYGKFVHTAGKFYNDAEADKGLQTSQDARFYALSNKFTPFSNKDDTLVIQFSVKHEQNIDCGGGYLKVFDCSVDQKDLHGENHLINKDIRCKDDVFTHFYTLVVRADNTYEVLIDNEKVESGSLEDDWDFLPPKKIKDPEAKKPEDWDDRATIADPDDTKPEDWDKPEHIPDPDATKPDDWDDEMDGEWEPPMIDNPEYKGEWKPKQIDNPAYKGVWVHPEIDNPEYEEDKSLYLREEVCAVGIDVWQVKSGTIFDNFMITNDLEEAKKVAASVKETQEGKKVKDAQEAEERKKAEEEAAAEEAAKDDEDEDDEDDADNALPGEATELDDEGHDEL